MKDSSRFINVAAGRRGAKTFLAAVWKLTNLVNNPNSLGIYVASTYNQASRVFFRLFASLCPREFLKGNPRKSSPQEFHFKNGSILEIHGAHNYDSLRGGGYHFAILDEVADIPHDAWTQVIRPALSDTLGRCLKIGTPKGKNNWFFEDCMSDAVKFYTWTSLEGGIVPASEIEAAKRELDERTFRQEYEASFEALAKCVVYTYSKDNITDIRFNPSYRTVLAYDFNVNPMTCLVNQEQPNGTWAYVKEFIVPNSNSIETTEIACQWLRENNFTGLLEVTGDRSGGSRSTNAMLPTSTDYILIHQVLQQQKFNANYRLPRKVKTKQAAISTLNAAFKTASGRIKQYVYKVECPILDKSLQLMEWTEFSGGVKYDGTSKWSHAVDTASYHAHNYINIQEYE